ncbi:MAG: hypothetical protein ACI8RZ_003141 [Myxococcota bacterium]|jgi:hypothetical protein
MTTPARFSQSPLKLIRRAIGTRTQRMAKRRRLAYALRCMVIPGEVRRRLERLREAGIIHQIPGRMQLVLGSTDMFRFFILPCADDYYRSKGITFSFHALLRFLDDPASVADPTGLLSHPDAIIGHLMQVVHADPVYDLELLTSIDGGLASLEAQLLQMLAGTHLRSSSIGAIIEEPDYHARLLEYTRAFQADPGAAERMRRDNLTTDSPFYSASMTFGSMGSAVDYFATMPGGPIRGLWRLLRFRAFPGEDGGRSMLVAVRGKRKARRQARRQRVRSWLAA